MARAPLLNKNVVDSLDVIVASILPADYIGTDKEAGVRFLTLLIKHYRSPEDVAKRAALNASGSKYKKEKRNELLNKA